MGSRGSKPGERRGGKQKGTPNKRTVAKLQQIGAEIAAAKKAGGPVRARDVLSDLTKTAVGFTAHWQQKMMAWEAAEASKPVPAPIPPEYVERFLEGMAAATRAAAALIPYQDPKLAAIKVSMSPFDVAPEPKTIEGKAIKPIDIKDPIELARIYSQVVRAA